MLYKQKYFDFVAWSVGNNSIVDLTRLFAGKWMALGSQSSNPLQTLTVSFCHHEAEAGLRPAMPRLGSRVCHLQFFLISLLFQAGIYPRHTKEQEKYRSYMVYVYIFQRFLTFVLYKHCLMVEKGEIISNCPKQSKTKLRSSHRRSKVRVF